VITESSPPGLEEVWPEVSRRLTQCLRARGASSALTEDVVQETALRALQARVTFTSADDLMRWARVVAGRLVVDAHRRRRFITDAELPDRAAPDDVLRQVQGRLALEAVGGAMRILSPAEREALLDADPLHAPNSRREAVKLNVRRHRVRVGLRSVVDGILGILLGLGLRIRRWLDALPDNVAQLAGVVVTAGVLLLTSGEQAPAQAQVAGPSVARPTGQIAPVDTRGSGAAVGPAQPSSPGRADPPRSTTGPTPPRNLARMSVPVPGANTAEAGLTEASPDDSHVACVVVSWQPTCVDSPVMLSSPPALP
jgi:hypothetical protein